MSAICAAGCGFASPGGQQSRHDFAHLPQLLAVQHQPDADLDGIERYLIQFWPAEP